MRMETFNVLLASASIVALAVVVLVVRMNRYTDKLGNRSLTGEKPQDQNSTSGDQRTSGQLASWHSELEHSAHAHR